MQREKMINPSVEEVHELRVAVNYANKHFPFLRGTLFSCSSKETTQSKYNALFGLYKSNKMKRALELMRSFYEDVGINIPDELYGMSYNKRRFYIVEMLILLSEYLGGADNG